MKQNDDKVSSPITRGIDLNDRYFDDNNGDVGAQQAREIFQQHNVAPRSGAQRPPMTMTGTFITVRERSGAGGGGGGVRQYDGEEEEEEEEEQLTFVSGITEPTLPNVRPALDRKSGPVDLDNSALLLSSGSLAPGLKLEDMQSQIEAIQRQQEELQQQEQEQQQQYYHPYAPTSSSSSQPEVVPPSGQYRIVEPIGGSPWYFCCCVDDINDPSTTKRGRLKCAAIILAITLLAVAIGMVTAVVSIRQSNSNSSSEADGDGSSGEVPTGAPTLSPEMQEKLRLALQLEMITTDSEVTTSDSITSLLNELPSYQRLAFDWMLEEDETTDSLLQLDTNDVPQLLQDRFALVSLYYGVKESTSTATDTFTDELDLVADSNWLVPSLSVCEWEGVQCNNNDMVVELNLRDLELSGTLPATIGYLRELTRVNLQQNDFYGTIPTEIGSLRKLTFLQFFNNQFVGPLPTEFNQLSELSVFVMGTNRLNGTLPSTWGSNFPKLTQLSLDNNAFIGTLPPEWSQLAQLERLDLWNNPLSSTVPTEWSQLTSLKQLWLYQTDLTGSVDDIFCQSTSRTWLEFWADCQSLPSPELECSCCTRCCRSDGSRCQMNNLL